MIAESTVMVAMLFIWLNLSGPALVPGSAWAVVGVAMGLVYRGKARIQA